ncbi:GntR family transcriptional regulator [Murinocardiopsis flavida]|uniref:GntR family transcriptional regulator n=1 Tax=Murinocardiopsis flavida TaxID=645275 RepID=A0A2P8CDN1_9ACTN|nr:GntR family transcriptional regulator [Murinocardiopsis flavida]PSK83060.1 GntR family transcriptional regulator [Murinocardiopsis flavida]
MSEMREDDVTANSASGRPLFEQVADELRTQIDDGVYPGGEALPTEAELVGKFGVSRQTVRKALERLGHEGLVTSGRGRGRIVREYQPLSWHLTHFENEARRADTAEGTDAWSAQVQSQGREPREQVAVSIIQPPKEISDRLQLDPEVYVVLRQRQRLADGVLYQLSSSYFPQDIVEGTQLMAPMSVSAPGGVLAASGHRQLRYIDEIRCRMPDPDEARAFGIPGGTPVFRHMRTGYGEEGRPLRVMVTVTPGDRHVLIYEVNA